MTIVKFTPSRRTLLAAALPALLFAASAFAEKSQEVKVPLEELLAPGALPDIVEGKADAPVTIVEYASMTCSHCAAFHHDVYPTLKKDFIDTGKVKFILREFPLDERATAAFMLARALDDKRDAAVDFLFAQQKNWAFTDTPFESLASVVKQIGIGQAKFEETLKDAKLQQAIYAVAERGGKFGVHATPTFFINGVRLDTKLEAADLPKIIGDAAAKSASNGGTK
jgi:protein-disulfide isomerase